MTGLVERSARNQIFIATIAGTEVVSSVIRRQKSATISAMDAVVMLSDFQRDYDTWYRHVAVNSAVIARA